MNELLMIVQEEAVADIITEAGGNSQVIPTSAVAVNEMLAVSEGSYTDYPEIAICMENSEDGKRATHVLETTLEQQGITCHIIDLYEGNQNYLDATMNGVNNLSETIQDLLVADSIEAHLQAVRAQKHIKTNSASSYLDEFLDGIHSSADTPYYPTQFKQLDSILDGGLYEGLYVIGAISSLGKTTFSLQIADNLAQQGHDVLVFSLEMARTELMSKSISRITALEATKQGLGLTSAKTSRGITTGSRYTNYSQTEKNLIKESVGIYGEYSKNVYIYEGVGDIGVKEVREVVEEHVSATGKHPIVFIDYLQILSPYNDRATDKQNTDKAVLELKRLARDFKIPVWAVSSFNRASYDKEVTMASFKESGAVEYSADVLIGMDLYGVGERGFNAQEEKAKEVRDINIKILKNRNGGLGEPIRFGFHPMFNYFEEAR